MLTLLRPNAINPHSNALNSKGFAASSRPNGTMARIFPLLVILLIGLTVALKGPRPDRVRDRDLPPAALKRVTELRRELQGILSEKCKRLLFVIREMVWARRCIYNGLPYPAYEKARAVCKNRSESLDALREYRRSCYSDARLCDEAKFDQLFDARQKAVAACDKIGWDGDKDCPSLRALKEEFERTKDACRGKVDRIKEIREEIAGIKASFAKPSVAPVARVFM